MFRTMKADPVKFVEISIRKRITIGIYNMGGFSHVDTVVLGHVPCSPHPVNVIIL